MSFNSSRPLSLGCCRPTKSSPSNKRSCLWPARIVMNIRKIHKYGFVRLDDAMADDLSVVNSARVSFNVHHEAVTLKDHKLIEYLMQHEHGTPFEHNSFRFHVKCPIALAREWFRHRIGSFNEEASRYSQLQPEVYIPALDGVGTP